VKLDELLKTLKAEVEEAGLPRSRVAAPAASPLICRRRSHIAAYRD
jgi:hypothetical protein